MTAYIVWRGASHDGYPMLGSRRAHRLIAQAMAADEAPVEPPVELEDGA